jgi:hypothetical protein
MKELPQGKTQDKIMHHEDLTLNAQQCDYRLKKSTNKISLIFPPSDNPAYCTDVDTGWRESVTYPPASKKNPRALTSL